jgi:hypothetical protein
MNKALFAALTDQDLDAELNEKHFKDLEGRNSEGFTPFEYALGVGAIKCAEALLEQGANPKISALSRKRALRDKPITNALIRKAPRVACALIDGGAPLVEGGDHVMHIAAKSSGGWRVIQYLIDVKGLDVDLLSKQRTPLQAAMRGISMPSIKVVEALVSRGANVTLPRGKAEHRPGAGAGLVADQSDTPLKDLYARHADGKIKDLKALHVALNTSPGAPKKSKATAKPIDHTAASGALIAPYVKQAVTAKLDGKLFEHVPATFHFFFQPPKTLRAALRESYEDETQGWSWGELVPVAAVSFDAKRANAFAYLFLDWRGGKPTPSVVVTTTDRWDATVGVKSLATLRLKVGEGGSTRR